MIYSVLSGKRPFFSISCFSAAAGEGASSIATEMSGALHRLVRAKSVAHRRSKGSLIPHGLLEGESLPNARLRQKTARQRCVKGVIQIP